MLSRPGHASGAEPRTVTYLCNMPHPVLSCKHLFHRNSSGGPLTSDNMCDKSHDGAAGFSRAQSKDGTVQATILSVTDRFQRLRQVRQPVPTENSVLVASKRFTILACKGFRGRR